MPGVLRSSAPTALPLTTAGRSPTDFSNQRWRLGKSSSFWPKFLKPLVPAAQVLGQELAGLFREILEDRARFEDRHRLAAAGRLVVDDRRHAVVRADLEEIRLELLAGADVHRNDFVRQAAFLEHDGDLPAVGRRPVIKVDHEGLPLGSGLAGL